MYSEFIILKQHSNTNNLKRVPYWFEKYYINQFIEWNNLRSKRVK